MSGRKVKVKVEVEVDVKVDLYAPMKTQASRTRHRIIRVAAAGLLLGTPAAFPAEVIEFAVGPDVPTDPASLEWPLVVHLPKFDLTLGTLSAIRFTFTSTVTADVGLENLQVGAANTLDYSLPMTAQFQVPTAASPTRQDFTLTTTSGPLGSYDGDLDFGGTSGITVSLGPTGGVSTLDIAPADFAAYTRSGAPANFDVSLYLDRGAPDVQRDGAKLYDFTQSVVGQSRVTVSYLYSFGEEVPEAGGWIAGAGLAGLLCCGWRWRQRGSGGR